MIKTLSNLLKQDKEKYKVPRKVQDVIPIRRMWSDGIFQVGSKFSKSYQFSDINYQVASLEDKKVMFLDYSELLNSLDSGATTKITINNRRLNRANFEQSILMPLRGDSRDVYRREYNQMLLDKATGANGIMQEKYITITVGKKNIEDARTYFARVGADLTAHFAALGSKCVELDATERLRILHDFYRQGEETGIIPTLCTLREKLMEQPEEKAREIALSLELFTTGSLDIFGHGSNVDLDKRVVVFNIHDLGEQLKPTGLLVITDTMLNRVTLNWKRGKRTHVFIDEFHVVFENEYSGNFFNSAWRQFRKRNAYPTAITQNVEYLLDSVQASTMLSNSEFIVMLNQAASDREKLARLLNISNEQMSYVTNADAGCGLIKYGSALVPFVNRFPKDTQLYKLMTTKPGEGVFGGRGKEETA